MGWGAQVRCILRIGKFRKTFTTDDAYFLQLPNHSSPDLPQVPLAIAVFGCVFSLAMLFLGLYHKPRQCGVSVAIISLGLPVYVLGPLWTTKPRCVKQAIRESAITAMGCYLAKFLKRQMRFCVISSNMVLQDESQFVL